jgi:dTDP-4-dehydrorhamnose reductase
MKDSKGKELRVAIVGAAGGLGRKVVEVVSMETPWEIIAITRDEVSYGEERSTFNSRDHREWRRLFDNDELTPDAIINCAAMTDVDRCETERSVAWESNVKLVEHIINQCKRSGSRYIHISTDYVFDGRNGPYSETSTPNPINYYGKTKLAAENLCAQSRIDYTVIRTMWLYGEDEGRKRSFVKWIADTVGAGQSVNIVTDEIGSPSLVDDVAYGIIKSIERQKNGIVNIAGPEVMSRWDFAMAVADVYHLDRNLFNPITTAQLNRVARRPLRSGLIPLQAQTTLGLTLTPLREGLRMMRVREERYRGM